MSFNTTNLSKAQEVQDNMLDLQSFNSFNPHNKSMKQRTSSPFDRLKWGWAWKQPTEVQTPTVTCQTSEQLGRVGPRIKPKW